MSPTRIVAFGLSLLTIGTALAQDVPVEKYKLPNGLTVILHQDRSLPIATINTWFRVGSKDEPDRRSGFAHLFEHLMFMGTKRVPNGQFDQIMEKLGGSNNATTSQDRTNYFSSGPSSILPTLLWLDADRLQALADNMDQKKLDLQRDVVKNERRQSVENAPYGQAYNELGRLMYPKGHPYSWSVIGSHEDLSAATVADVQDFFRTYYVPNNASIVVAGDFDPATMKPIIARYFGSLPRGNDAPRRDVPNPKFTGVRRTTMVDKVEQTKVIMAWHSAAAYQPGDAELQVASGILSDGVSSRLYQKLVAQDRVATEVNAYQEHGQLGSMFVIEANLADGVSVERLEAAMDTVINGMLAAGPTKSEVDQQVAKLETNLLQSLQSLDQKADRLNEFEFYLGNPNSFKTVLDGYRALTPDSVKTAFAENINLWNRLIVRVQPQTEAPAQDPLDEQPVPTAPAPFTPKGPTELTLSNGIKVYYWRRENLPLMHVTTVFKGGSAQDAPTQSGLAAITSEMLTQGTTSRSAAEFAEQLQLLGSDIYGNVSPYSTAFSLNCLADKFGRSLALYADALGRPAFNTADWERVKRTELASLEQQLSNPVVIAGRVAAREFFGANHPLGLAPSNRTVSSLTVADLRLRHSLIYQPANAVIFAAGSLPGPAVKFELEKAFRSWTGSGRSVAAAVTPVPEKKPLRVVLVDRPGAVQSVVRFFMPSQPYGSPERLPLNALGTILGGSFTSRLNQNLREDKGYTYGANARFTFLPNLGYLSSGASVRTDVTGASLKEFIAEFNKFRKDGVSADEARKAASIMETNIIESLATLEGVVSVGKGLYDNDRAFGTLGEDLTMIRAMTEGVLDAQAAAAIPFENALIVIVGDKKAILPQLEGLGLPTPVEVSAE